MIGEVPKFGPQEPALPSEGIEKEAKVPEQKTERVARGIFGNVKHWYENQFKPWLERSWKWIVGAAAAVVAAIAGIALALWFTKKERKPSGDNETAGPKVAAEAPVSVSKGAPQAVIAEAVKPDALKRPASELSAKQPSLNRLANSPQKPEKSAPVKAEILPVPSRDAGKLPQQKDGPASVQAAIEPAVLSQGSALKPSGKEAAIACLPSPGGQVAQTDEKCLSETLPPEIKPAPIVLQTSVTKKVEITLGASKPAIKKTGDETGAGQKKIQLTGKSTIELEQAPLDLPEQKKPGKLNLAKLSLSINPKALLPGAVKPPAAASTCDQAQEKESRNADKSHLLDMLKTKPQGPKRRLPAKLQAKVTRAKVNGSE